jgi:hypothetical protein
LEENFRKITFALRNRWLGRIRLRTSLPSLKEPVAETPEQRFYELILKKSFTSAELRSFSCVLDVGSRNGSYLPALSRSCPEAKIIGIELDGGRRYWNGYRRCDYGEAHANALRCQGRGVHYLWKNFHDLSATSLGLEQERAVLITLFYPFVSPSPCAAWGLPSRFADYPSLLRKLDSYGKRKAPHGLTTIIAAHQGEWEAGLARSAYEWVGFKFHETSVRRAEFSTLWPSEHDVFLFRIRVDNLS